MLWDQPGLPPPAPDGSNAAAQLITGTKKYKHSIPTLVSLQWLTVKDYIKTFIALVPKCISDLLTCFVPSRPLRSADRAMLVIPRSHLVPKGVQAFSVEPEP